MQSKQTSKQKNGEQQLGQLLSELNELAKSEGRKYVEVINYIKEHKTTKEALKKLLMEVSKYSEATATMEVSRMFRLVRPFKDIKDFLAGNHTIGEIRELNHHLMVKLQRKAKKVS